MQVTEAAKAGLTGWRARAAEAVAEPVAERTRFSRDQLLAVLGALSLALATWRYLKLVRRVVASSKP